MKLRIHATPNARHDAVRVMLDAVGDMLDAVSITRARDGDR